MRKRFIAYLAVFAMIATMVPGVAMAAVKDEVNQEQYVSVSGGDNIVTTVYYGAKSDAGTVNVIVTGNVSLEIRDGSLKDETNGWKKYNDNGTKWNKVYRENANETVEFVTAWDAQKGWTKSQTVEINVDKFDTEKPVITFPGTEWITEVQKGADYQIPEAVVTDDISVDLTAEVDRVFYADTYDTLQSNPARYDGEFTTNVEEGWYKLRYYATDDSGKTSYGTRVVNIVDTVAPSVTPIDQIKVDKGDILDIAALIDEIEASAEDASGIKEVRLDAARYTETRASEEEIFGDEFEQLDVADIPDALEMDQVGFYEFVFAVEDNALETNTAYVPVIVEVSEIYGTAGFTINYVDKDGKAVGEPTVIEKENAVLSYGYDEDGNKITFYDFAYEQDGYVLNVPEGYYVADEKDFNGLTDPVTVFVENGGENTADEYDVIVTAVEKDAPAADEELTPPAPKTGDDMNMGLLAGLAALMVMAGTGAIVVGRKVFNK